MQIDIYIYSKKQKSSIFIFSVLSKNNNYWPTCWNCLVDRGLMSPDGMTENLKGAFSKTRGSLSLHPFMQCDKQHARV